MNILLHKDILLAYIRNEGISDEDRDVVSRILFNRNLKFTHSRKYFELLRLDLRDEFEGEYQALVKRMVDSRGNVANLGDASDFDSEVLRLLSATPSKVIPLLCLNPPSDRITNVVPNACILSSVLKPNYHWLVLKLILLSPSKVTVNKFDFATDVEIKQFFDDIFSIPTQIRHIYIFDRYKGFNHNRFDSFRQRDSVHFHTLYDKRNFHNDEILIRNFFRRVRIFTTTQRELLHGRRIAFENLVVMVDNGFENVVRNSDWTLDIQYCPETFANWISECGQYRRE